MVLLSILKIFAGNHHRRFVKKCQPAIRKINELEKRYQSLTNEQLQAKTAEFIARHKKGESLDKLLPEAFAVVKNAARRLSGTTHTVCEHEMTWEMVHYSKFAVGNVPCVGATPAFFGAPHRPAFRMSKPPKVIQR